jgi:hypothetical protein
MLLFCLRLLRSPSSVASISEVIDSAPLASIGEVIDSVSCQICCLCPYVASISKVIDSAP